MSAVDQSKYGGSMFGGSKVAKPSSLLTMYAIRLAVTRVRFPPVVQCHELFPLVHKSPHTHIHVQQPGITPYRAHAHERYSSMYRVPEHVFLTFFVIHRTKCKPMHFE